MVSGAASKNKREKISNKVGAEFWATSERNETIEISRVSTSETTTVDLNTSLDIDLIAITANRVLNVLKSRRKSRHARTAGLKWG